jgi:hypothetical protein
MLWDEALGVGVPLWFFATDAFTHYHRPWLPMFCVLLSGALGVFKGIRLWRRGE